MTIIKRKIFLLVILQLILSILVGFGFKSKVFADDKVYEKLKIFAEVLSIVENNYVEEVDTEKLIEGSVKGMLRTLDPHSSFMTEEMFNEMKVDTRGAFGGLGIEITLKEDILTIVSPMEDTPAYNAGVKAGDKIIMIDDESTRDMSLSDAVKRLRGEPGTVVKLKIIREEFKEPVEIEITRAIIKIKSVLYKTIDKEIGYIKIRRFSKNTDSELDDALKKIDTKELTGLVLDLRNNPGGLLEQAALVSDKFLKKDKLVVYTKGRIDEQNIKRITKEDGIFIIKPIIVLVNSGSASASEIVAGALQDHKRAIILGTQTFGKGSVQTVMPLAEGAALRLTTALYYTPNGRLIQGIGIKPDIIVENDIETVSSSKNKKKKSIHEIREKDLKNHIKGNIEKSKKDNHVREEKISSKVVKDNQKERAISLLKTLKIFSARING